MSSFGGTIKLTGESEYQKALRQINQNLRELSSDLKVATSSYDKNDKSLKNLTTQQDNLNKKLNEQQDKIKVLTARYNEVNATYGKNSTAQKELNKELDTAKAKLFELGKELGTNSTEYKAQEKVVRELEGRQESYNKAVSEAKIKLNDAQSEYNKTSVAVDKLGKEIEDTNKPTDQLNKELEESRKRAKDASEGFTIFKGVVADLASKAIQSALNGLKKLGTALINVGKSAVDSYAEYEQLVGGVETLFKDSAGIVQQYAAEAYKTAGVSANKYMEQATSFSASLLQGLGGDTKKAAEYANMAIIDMSDNANKMGTSIEMIQNAYQGFAKDNFTMLDNLKLGYGGTAGEMARLINETGVMGKAFKATAKNVKDVPFDKMIEAIHKVQKNMGITGTTSLEASETIQGSVNSMKASWQNLLTAIADDNQDLSKSVNQFVRSTVTAARNLVPRIKVVVEGIKKLLMSIVKDVFPRLKREIPELKPIISVFEWFIKNKSLVVKSIQAMIAAFAVNKVLKFSQSITDVVRKISQLASGTAVSTAATNADTTAQVANTTAKTAGATATGLLTKATNLLNAAWKANPVGVVVAGVTAAVGIYSIFKGKTEELTEAEKRHQEELDKVNETLDTYASKMEEADEARQEYLDKNVGELNYYEDLYKELKVITDENGKVQKGYEKRADFIVTTLNDAFGTEIEMTGNVIKKYGDLEDKINDIIKAKRAQYFLEANEGKYNTARDEKVKLEEAYANALTESKYREDERNKSIQEMADYLGISTEHLKKFIEEDGKINTDSLREYAGALGIAEYKINTYSGTTYTKLNNAISSANKSFNEATETLDNSREAYLNNQETINDYEAALMYLKDKNYEAVLGIYEDTHDFIGKTDQETYDNYQKAIDMQKDYIQQLKDNKEEYDDDYIKTEEKIAKEKIKALKDEQAKYKQVTTEGLNEVNLIWNDSLDEQLSDITGHKVEFKRASKGQVQMYVDGVKEGKPKTKTEMAKLVDETIKEITKKDGEAKKAGEDLIDGINNGIKNQDKQSGVFAAISNFGSSLLQKLRSSLKEKSPSKATQEMGQFLLEGLGIGIKKEENSLYNQISSVGKNVLAGMSGSLQGLSVPYINANTTRNYAENTQQQEDLIAAFKQALEEMKIELDDEVMGQFVDKKVTKLIYT